MLAPPYLSPPVTGQGESRPVAGIAPLCRPGHLDLSGSQSLGGGHAALAGGEREAVVDGDFAMYETEAQAVLKALRKAGGSVVALHNHMIGEELQVVFLHFWGAGSVADLARARTCAWRSTRRRRFRPRREHR